MSTSIIIPFYKDVSGLNATLSALRRCAYIESCEVIVVDNGSPISVESITHQFPEVLTINEHTPGSYAARNHGIQSCNGEVVFLLDAGCIPSKQWITAGLAFLEAHPNVDFVGGNIRLTGAPWDQATLAEKYEALFAFRQQHSVEVGKVSVTANMAIRRRCFDKAGLFDATMLSGGDLLWCKRAQAAGLTIGYCREMSVGHPMRTTVRELVKKKRRTEAGGLVLYRKLYGRLAAFYRLIYPGVPLVHTINALVLRKHEIRANFPDTIRLFALLAYLSLVGYGAKLRLVLTGVAERE